MVRTSRTALISAVVLICVFPAFCAGAQDAPTGTILCSVKDLAMGIPLTNATLTLSPSGDVVSDNVLGLYAFTKVPEGEYEVRAWAPHYEPATLPVTVTARQWSTLAFALEVSADSPPDTDGDGLTDPDERDIHGTNELLPDSDLDGMPDLFEVEHGLNPNQFLDTLDDPDGDWLFNLLEYHLKGDPNDPTSPFQLLTLSPLIGVDSPDRGELFKPWRTINYAMEQVEGDETHRILLLLGSGTYAEDVILKPYVALLGPLFGEATVQGHVTGAEGAWLWRISLKAPATQQPEEPPSPLVYLTDVAMRIREVKFRGNVTCPGTSIATHGASGGSLIQNCTFANFQTAVAVYGETPLIRRCVFGPGPGDGIVLYGNPQTRAYSPMAAAKADQDNPLGRADDSNSGFNTFQELEGYAVSNKRSEPVLAERCDWGTNDPDEMAAMVEGEVSQDASLKAGTGLIPASIVCSVWDKVSRDAICDGAVELRPGGFIPITENDQGVYVIPCLEPNTYTVTMTAPGYHSSSQTTTPQSGQEKALVFPMEPKEEDDDDGDDDLPPDSGGCAKSSRGTAAGQAANGLPLLFAFAALVIAGRFRRR